MPANEAGSFAVQTLGKCPSEQHLRIELGCFANGDLSFSYYLCVAPIRVLYFRDKDAYIELPVEAARRELSRIGGPDDLDARWRRREVSFGAKRASSDNLIAVVFYRHGFAHPVHCLPAGDHRSCRHAAKRNHLDRLRHPRRSRSPDPRFRRLRLGHGAIFQRADAERPAQPPDVGILRAGRGSVCGAVSVGRLVEPRPLANLFNSNKALQSGIAG